MGNEWTACSQTYDMIIKSNCFEHKTGSVLWSGSMGVDEERRKALLTFERKIFRNMKTGNGKVGRIENQQRWAKDKLVRSPRENGGG